MYMHIKCICVVIHIYLRAFVQNGIIMQATQGRRGENKEKGVRGVIKWPKVSDGRRLWFALRGDGTKARSACAKGYFLLPLTMGIHYGAVDNERNVHALVGGIIHQVGQVAEDCDSAEPRSVSVRRGPGEASRLPSPVKKKKQTQKQSKIGLKWGEKW